MRLGAQIVKELLSYFRDPQQRLSLFGPPLIQLFILSSAATLEVSNVDIVVFNEDAGAASHEVIERIAAAHFVQGVRFVDRQASITRMIDRARCSRVSTFRRIFRATLPRVVQRASRR